MGTETPRTSSLRKNIRELVLIAGICTVSWLLSQYLNISEWVYYRTRTIDWLDELLVVSIVLSVCLTIFSARRWREMNTEVAKSLEVQNALIAREGGFRQLAAIIELSDDAIIGKDLNGIITSWNRGATNIFGYTSDEMVGTSITQLIPTDRRGDEERILGIIELGKRVEHFETQRLTKDGRLIDVSVAASPIKDDAGKTVGASKVVRDITKRRQLEAQRERMASLVEASPDFIAFADPKTMLIQYINKGGRRMCGIGEDEDLENIRIGDVHPDWMNQLFAEVIIPAAIRNGTWEGDGAFLHRDGHEVPVSMVLMARKAANGEVDIFYTVSRDITERKRTEQEILFKTALLEAQAETTIDGILVVDEANQIILSNQQFATMFGVPPALRTRDDKQLLRYVVDHVENSHEFIERVEYLYGHREEKSRDEIRLKDGKRFERYSSPLKDSANKHYGRIWYFRDVTERAKAEERMQLWSQVLDQSTEGIMICDPLEQILLVNKAFERLTGFSADEAVGQTPRIVHSGRQDRAFYTNMWKSVLETGSWQGEVWNRRKNGEVYPEWLSISAVHDQQSVLTHYVGIFSDITARKLSEDRMVHLAHYDALTDLPNRLLLMDRLNQLTTAARRRKSKVAVIFIDLDRFKEVNDSLGHDAGDVLLQAVSKRFSSVVRGEDTVARMGGDEFVVVIQGLRQAEDAAAIARELFACLSEPITLNGLAVVVTASMGISLYPDDTIDPQELIRDADAAMYQAKGAGRNAYHFYTNDLNQRALEMLSTENALRRAIERHDFVLHYQPQVDIASGSVVGAEALIRWNRADFGLVMPGNFISIAEERGLIVPIGNWIIDEAARQAAVWQNAGKPIRIAVNVSAIQFRQKDFVEQLLKSVQKHGISPNCLELELTERIVMRDAETTVKILESLHDLGFQLSIDDFGTGYSSLSYLRRFPIDKIKIDQSFLRDKGAESIVTAVISLARSLKLRVIAEGVETEKQLEVLRKQGCDEAQGFLFSPPVTAAEFALIKLV